MQQSCGPVTFIITIILTSCSGLSQPGYNGLPENIFRTDTDTVLSDTIIYHPVRVDGKGGILPWYSDNSGQSYDHVLSLVWNFWKNMEIDSNGMQYYMNHQ